VSFAFSSDWFLYKVVYQYLIILLLQVSAFFDLNKTAITVIYGLCSIEVKVIIPVC
jgi:hypothetical protein